MLFLITVILEKFNQDQVNIYVSTVFLFNLMVSLHVGQITALLVTWCKGHEKASLH